jgi:uncharacterized protein YjbI with pentapeptide repeats
MSFAGKIGSILSEVVAHPNKPSYIIESNGENLVIRPGGDYTNVDLGGQNLRGFDLRGSKFCDANLSGADLSGANLEGADLTGATLLGTRLSGARLGGSSYDVAALKQAIFEATPSGLPSGFTTQNIN